MDDVLSVRTADLGVLAETLDTQAHEINRQIYDLIGAANRLRGEWSGEAHDAFQTAQRPVAVHLQGQAEFLRTAAAAARDLETRYTEADATLAELFES